MASPTLRGVPLNWDAHPGDLPRQFSDRNELERTLQELFPEASGGLSPVQGGRRQAEALLGKVKPERYAKARNFLSGPVTRLSPYIRHGAISLAEVRDAVYELAGEIARVRIPIQGHSAQGGTGQQRRLGGC